MSIQQNGEHMPICSLDPITPLGLWVVGCWCYYCPPILKKLTFRWYKPLSRINNVSYRLIDLSFCHRLMRSYIAYEIRIANP